MVAVKPLVFVVDWSHTEVVRVVATQMYYVVCMYLILYGLVKLSTFTCGELADEARVSQYSRLQWQEACLLHCSGVSTQL